MTNRKNNKSNKNQDLEKKGAKKGPEMSANIAKIANIISAICGILPYLVLNRLTWQ